MAVAALVDTDVLIDYLRGVPQAVEVVLSIDTLAVSVVTVAELYAGLKSGKSGAKEKADIAKLLAQCEVLPVDAAIARDAGLLKKQFFASHAVELPDALIAATALLHQLPLLTLNVKHYPMLRTLVPAYRKAGKGSSAAAL